MKLKNRNAAGSPKKSDARDHCGSLEQADGLSRFHSGRLDSPSLQPNTNSTNIHKDQPSGRSPSYEGHRHGLPFVFPATAVDYSFESELHLQERLSEEGVSSSFVPSFLFDKIIGRYRACCDWVVAVEEANCFGCTPCIARGLSGSTTQIGKT